MDLITKLFEDLNKRLYQYFNLIDKENKDRMNQHFNRMDRGLKEQDQIFGETVNQRPCLDSRLVPQGRPLTGRSPVSQRMTY